MENLILEIIQNTMKYAVVVPCYNEEQRFPYAKFKSFAKQNPEVMICLVNDGSKDDTLAVLNGLKYECPGNVKVYSLEANSGKSEAVRQGVLHVHSTSDVSLIGFLDADLATSLEEWLIMAKYKEQRPKYGVVVGSRIARLGANIQRDDNRSFLSFIIKKFIGVILKTPFQDTQCGAKIFTRNIIPYLFTDQFLTPWLFDVEIFLRLQKKFGNSTLRKGVLEYPLMDWTEVGGSKLGVKDAVKIPIQLLKLFFTYNIQHEHTKNLIFTESTNSKKLNPIFASLYSFFI